MAGIKISLHSIKIPFRFKYGHSKAKHEGVESIFCLAQDAEGRLGIGEAVPRKYVTGESVDSVFEDFPGLIGKLAEVGITADGKIMSKNYGSEDKAATKLRTETSMVEPYPSCAWACLNTALFDLECRQQNIPLYKKLWDISQVENSQFENSGMKNEEMEKRVEAVDPPPLNYTASIGFGKRFKLLPQLLAYKFLGFKKYKIKVGNDQDMERIKWIQKILGPDVSYYADANGAWEKEEALSKIEALSKLGIWAIEEPLKVFVGGGTEIKHGIEEKKRKLEGEEESNWVNEEDGISEKEKKRKRF